MAHKPEIQYIDQFYVLGSEALARKQQEEQQQKEAEKARKKQQLQQRSILVDLGAILWTAAALVLLVAMVVSSVHLSRTWQDKELMESYVSNLQLNNSTLKHNYRISYDLEEIKIQAEELGLIPEAEAEVRYIRVDMPAPKEKWTFRDNVRWFFAGLFE